MVRIHIFGITPAVVWRLKIQFAGFSRQSANNDPREKGLTVPPDKPVTLPGTRRKTQVPLGMLSVRFGSKSRLPRDLTLRNSWTQVFRGVFFVDLAGRAGQTSFFNVWLGGVRFHKLT